MPISDLARRGRLLESRRDVDRVAGDERLALAADDDLARVDADPGLEARAPRSAARISAARGRRAGRRPRATTGIPKTAMTASPMNFSTVPPWRSTIVAQSSK